ncbi:MAG: ABC transporter permease [Cyclobacteriaceae bacterium]
MDKVVESYCRPELLEDLLGDLHEYYYRNCQKSRSQANLIFFIDVVKFFRLYTVRKPKIFRQMTFFNLIGNYFKTSTRSLRRNRLFSTINVVGLAISMSVGILMITYVNELLSYDQFHEKADRTYRILTSFKGITNEQPFDLASTSVFIGKKLQEDYTGLEKVLIMRRNFRADLAKEENVIAVEGLYAAEEFFDVFSFKLLSGNAATALKRPNSVVLTEKTATKLFKDKNPVGELVTSGEISYTVTGVIEDVPRNSHLQFEVLVSFSTAENNARNDEETTFFNYRNVWQNHVYLLLPEGQSIDAIQVNLDQIAQTENANHDRFDMTFELENILEIVPGRDLSNQIGPNMSWTGIYQLGGLMLIIIISACFNYTNLSIARSLRRAKEVGVRKVVGASRGQVFVQFVFEAVIISVLAVFFSYGLYLLIKPQFMYLILEDEMLSMNFELIHALYFLLFAVFIGFLAGVLPSIFLSKLKAISVLRDISKVKLFKGVSLRKVLIVVQFVASIALIIGSTISYRQYKYVLNFDLGFTTENVLNIPLKENDSKILMSEVTELPEILRTSRSSMVLSTGSIWSEYFKYQDPLDSADVYINYVDKEYVNVHEYDFVAGGTFPFEEAVEKPKFIIINETLAKRFNFETPQDAIGQKLTSRLRREDVSLEIIGVVSDFQYTTVGREMHPSCFVHGRPTDFDYLNLVVQTEDAVATMGKLEAIWSKIDKVHPFEAEFYDDQIQQAYSDQAVLFKVFGFLAFLAISISSMGLLGMAVFTTETRIKEISIRKVMGASEKNLIYILSKGFMFMLIVAAAIAVPLTYLFFESVILVEQVNRITIGAVELLSGVVLIFGLGILTIGWQTSKAAKTNPAEMLRSE